MKEPAWSDGRSSVHRLSEETIYLAADIIKCPTITVALLFLSQKKSLFSRLQLKCCISAFVNTRKLTAETPPRPSSRVCFVRNVSDDLQYSDSLNLPEGRGPGMAFLSLRRGP